MELDFCPFCRSEVRWCGENEPCSEDDHECHHIFCDDCKIRFEVESKEANDAEDMSMLRAISAIAFNKRAKPKAGVFFRPHKGSLKESIALAVPVKDIDDLITMIAKDLAPYDHGVTINRDTVKIIYYTVDTRIDWNTYIVTLEDYGVMGYINGKLK